MNFSSAAIETSYAFCRRMGRRAGSNFYAGFLLLPAEKRRAMDALYAFMRHTDDLADAAPADCSRRDALAAWRAALEQALNAPGLRSRGEPPTDPRDRSRGALNLSVNPSVGDAILPALADVVGRFRIPREHLDAVIDGVEMDLDHRRYETFDELRQYCQRVASAVGLACIHVWGFRGPEAFEPARQAGIALQLTNILRDLREDAQAGRVYLPLADLRDCGYSVDDLLAGVDDQRFRRLMAVEIARAEQFYRGGAKLWNWLEPDGRRVFGLMTATYRELLRKIASDPAVVFRRQVRLSQVRKLQLLARWSLFPPRIDEKRREKGEGRGERGKEGRAKGEGRQERGQVREEREDDRFIPPSPSSSHPSPLSLPPSALRLPPSTVAIVGGGLAGLAAAVAALESGLRVELFEQARWLGGRAGSFVDSDSGQRIDYCRHVAMGCCTSFLDFCRRTGIEDCFDRTDTLHFIGPEGTRHDFTPSRWLPAPLHLLPSLLRMSYLSPGERWGIIRAMGRLLREQSRPEDVSPLSLGEGSGVRAADALQNANYKLQIANCKLAASNPQSLIPNPSSASPHPNPLPEGEGTVGSLLPKREETIGQWLRRQGQSDRAIERFWSIMLVGALSETVDRASLAAAQKVFRDGFLASREASELVLPRLPLGEIFNDRLGKWLADRGVNVHLDTPVRRIEGAAKRAETVVLADGTRRTFDAVIVAVPWHGVRSLLAENLLAAMPALAGIERIEPAAITAVHLWFDRPITSLPHAVLVGRLSQWLFSSPHTPCAGAAHGVCRVHYCQVVISAAHRLAARKHNELLAEVRRELESIWPAVRAARLLHGRVVAQPAAVFSCLPGLDRFRPPQQTPIENLVLAGDWTATGWPATMEGAIRSGYRAVRGLRS